MMTQNSPLGQNINLLCPMFEMFHPFKILLERIWTFPLFYYTFWAPWRHVMYPNHSVFLKPKLKDIEINLTCLRLSYPEIRDELKRFLDKGDMKNKCYCHARNLYMVFEFLIPMVRVPHITKKSSRKQHRTNNDLVSFACFICSY